MDPFCLTTSAGVCMGSTFFGLAHCLGLEVANRRQRAFKRILKRIASAKKEALERKQYLEQQINALQTTIAHQDITDQFAVAGREARLKTVLESMRMNQQRIEALETSLAEKDRAVASLEGEIDAQLKKCEDNLRTAALDLINLDDQGEDGTGTHSQGQPKESLLRSHTHKQGVANGIACIASWATGTRSEDCNAKAYRRRLRRALSQRVAFSKHDVLSLSLPSGHVVFPTKWKRLLNAWAAVTRASKQQTQEKTLGLVRRPTNNTEFVSYLNAHTALHEHIILAASATGSPVSQNLQNVNVSQTVVVDPCASRIRLGRRVSPVHKIPIYSASRYLRTKISSRPLGAEESHS